ncbi:glycosyltransferase [Flagellimonas lutaonensis]|uniref:Glycosyltransferase n=2 Tax=Flagellimonas lutaonensis TaxID=516051 RepID=A0A0D5YQI6_9FLAO|nr:glycosyltransferase [Allomuricauda lutaonensis]
MLRKIGLGLLKKMKFLPPETYVKIYYEYYTGKKLDLDNPVEFNQKIQWLKVYYKPPILTQLVDKYSVREYVAEKIGKKYLNQLLLVAEKPSEINFDKLPNRFVVKGVHGYNFNLIVKNKEQLNKTKARLKFRKWLAKNQYYRGGLEWAYKNVPRRLIVEKYLEEPGKKTLYDYKFYCFKGMPKFIQVDIDRGYDPKIAFYDLKWNKLPISKGKKGMYEGTVKKPEKLYEMIGLATVLADNFPFVRIDLYFVQQDIYFGEMTFYPGDGRQEFKPDLYNKVFGDYLDLPPIPSGQKFVTSI